MNEQESAAPTNKIMAATVGAAISTILVYIVEQAAAIDLPAGVEGAMVVLAVFAAGYLIRD